MTLSIEQVLTRGAAEVLPKPENLFRLMNERKIKVYLGIDPTGAFLTLGHAVVLRKLQQFADLGHEVVLLIGNGTVRIGDPTGRDSTRPVLTDEVIAQNFQNWKSQASKVLDFNKITIVHNGDWLDQLSLADMVNLMGKVSVQQLMERDMFQERVKKGRPVYGHEIMYPMLQGYDSVAMEVDLEIGGTDQTFNMLMGRTLLREYKDKEKYVLSTPIINGTDGRKMSKSYNNYIALTDEPNDIFGKIMSTKDEEMKTYFEIFTDIDMPKAERLIESSPRDAKVKLATEIVTWLHDEEAATGALKDFETKFVKKETPNDIQEVTLPSNKMPILEILVDVTKFAPSKGEARRLVQQGGVSINGNKVEAPNFTLEISEPVILKVGKENLQNS